jgi:hypothetical protein
MPRHETLVRNREFITYEVPLPLKRSVKYAEDTAHFFAVPGDD